MKVAIISRGTPNERYPLYGIFEFDLAKALTKKGIEVAFIAIDFRNLSYKRSYGLKKYQKDGVHVFELSLPIGVYRRALHVLQLLLLIPFRAMLKSFGKPDIVHAHFYSIAAIATILKRKYGIPFVITEHSSKLNKPAEQISRLDKRLVAKAYSHADLLLCVSEMFQKSILSNFAYRSTVIPNMVDNQSFNYDNLPKNNSPFVFTSVGNLIPRKAFDKLISAFSQTNDDTLLYIIGEGPERKNLETQIQQLGLQEQVKLLGALERSGINKVFQKSNVFVLVSSVETFGVCYIEAMYAGLPVIATRCGGPESFVDESNGLLVPVNEVDELVKAMRDIRSNYAHYNPQQISSHCIERFSPEIIAGRIIAVYSELITFAGET